LLPGYCPGFFVSTPLDINLIRVKPAWVCARYSGKGSKSLGNGESGTMQISDTVEINAPPEVLFDWLSHLDQHYRQWHPDHRDCYWLRGDHMAVGSVLYAEEILHNKLHKLRYRITRVEPGRSVEFQLLGSIGLLVPRGVFSVTPTANGCRFTATLYPRAGGLLQHLMPGRVNALITHQQEEGESLQRILGVGQT